MNRDRLVFLVVVGLFAAVNLGLFLSGRLPANAEGVGILLAAGVSLALYSFLYKDNPLFKLAEHLYVGVVAAYELGQVWFQNMLPDVLPRGAAIYEAVRHPIDVGWALLGDPRQIVTIGIQVVPVILGLFLMTRLTGRSVWLSRISFAFIVGLGAGLVIPRRSSAYVLDQLGPTIQPLWTEAGFAFSPFLILLGVVSVLIYFSFSFEHTGAVGAVSRVGIWFLMVSFGASFGYTVMARLSLLIGQLTFLLEKWLTLNLPLW